MRKLKKGDQVLVRTGKDKGKRGTVLRVLPDQKVVVEGINMVKKHTRGNPQRGTQGGIIETEKPLHASNVGLYNSANNRADRVGIKTLEDGKRVRVFKSTGEVVDL